MSPIYRQIPGLCLCCSLILSGLCLAPVQAANPVRKVEKKLHKMGKKSEKALKKAGKEVWRGVCLFGSVIAIEWADDSEPDEADVTLSLAGCRLGSGKEPPPHPAKATRSPAAPPAHSQALPSGAGRSVPSTPIPAGHHPDSTRR
jgi:hypothetical protein